MRLTLTTVLSAFLIAISGPAHAVETARDILVKRKDPVAIERLLPFLSIYHQFLLYPVQQDCKNPTVWRGRPTCFIDVDVWLVNSGGIDFCLTQFPYEVTFDRLTRVVWKLKAHTLTSATTGKTYNMEFHRDHGILPFLDRFQQILGGGYGDSDVANRWWFHRLNLYSNADPTIVYLPMILQVSSTDPNDVGVCAVGDPRMVNA